MQLQGAERTLSPVILGFVLRVPVILNGSMRDTIN